MRSLRQIMQNQLDELNPINRRNGMIYPLTHSNGSRDKRYSVEREYCGYADKRFVLRFCGEFIGSFISLPDATLRAVGHRNPNPPIVEQRNA